METALTILGILGIFVAIVVVAVLFLRLVDRLTLGRSLSPEEQAAAEAENEWRLRNPRFAELQSHFGKPLPAELQALYENTDLVLQRNLRFATPDGEEEFIQRFLPADRRTLEEWGLGLGQDVLPIALDDFGNCYYVYVRPQDADLCPVFFCDHDGGDISKVADSIGDFVARCVLDEHSQPT